MTALNLSKMAVAAAMTAALGISAIGQGVPNRAARQQGDSARQFLIGGAKGRSFDRTAVKRVIVVSLVDHKLALVEDGKVVKVYPVAVGKPSTPSPAGTFTIVRRVANPIYNHDGRTVLPGPRNPVGTRWMGLSIRGYGIHGTNEPRSIGKAASHGCIRMARADIEQLFGLVSVGDTVELVDERNAETAQLFGDGPKPALYAAAPKTPEPKTQAAKNDAKKAAPGLTAQVEQTAGARPGDTAKVSAAPVAGKTQTAAVTESM